jgi:dinuclear metal center YbgI/SA1388 family protein
MQPVAAKVNCPDARRCASFFYLLSSIFCFYIQKHNDPNRRIVPTVADVITFLERFAPLDLAEEWDNVGLLAGDRLRETNVVLTCLTLTPDVAREAIERQAGLIVTHHPLLFRPVKRLTADDAEGRMLLALIAAGVAVYSPHTAYDSAPDGINEQLARLLGLTDVEPLRALPKMGNGKCKIVCFVPRSHLSAVQEALWSAGAGVIGEYSKCSFVLDGRGSFEGSAASNPAVGQAQRLEQVDEARLEVVCPETLVGEAVERMRQAHPYEEPAVDVYPLQNLPDRRGAGRVGLLTAAESNRAGGNAGLRLADFLTLVRKKLCVTELPFVGDCNQPVSRVAIACGSGGEFLHTAIARHCDVLLTGEARFHTCLEARTAGIGLVTAGHYGTERPAMEYLAGVLSRAFPGASVCASRVEQDPIQWK